MGRKVAVALHDALSLVAGALYFFFVLPRWWELSYQVSHSFGTVMRIVCGAIIGLAALPVVFTLLRNRKPEYGTPRMALTLLLWSVVFHVLAGALIIGAAVSEIWLSLDDAGQWLFGVYGAAAAIAILGITAFYLAFVAAMPPPPPRPLQSKERKRRLRRKDKNADEEAEDKPDDAETTEEATEDEKESTEETTEPDESPTEEPAEEKSAEVTAKAKVTTKVEKKPADDKPDEAAKADEKPDEADDTVAAEPAHGGLRNRRPSGKTATSRRRRRLRGGVAVED